MIPTLVLSALLCLAAAQQTKTITIPNVGGDSNSVAASVVTAASGATTLELHCVKSPCGLFPAHTLVYGPSTYHVDMSDPNSDFTATMDCKLASSTAVCKETAGGNEANFPGSSTTSYEGTEIGSATITITAGADKLAQTGSAAASQTSVQGASKSAKTASITPAPGSTSASRSGSAAAATSTAGAVINALIMGGCFVGAAAGVVGGLLL